MRIDAAGANDDPCDVVVADVRKNGPYGLVQIEGPLRDPLCLWRFDDANGGGDEAMMTRFSSAGGTVMSLGSSGTRSSSSILPTMRTLQPAIRKCLEREKLGPAIRLRVRVTAAGAVEGVIFDYRVSTEEHARDCVAFALQRQKFPAEKGSDAGADATTFTLAFSLRN